MTVSPIPSLGSTRERRIKIRNEILKAHKAFVLRNGSRFIPSSEYFDAIADAIMPLFPVGAGDVGWRKPETLPHPKEAGLFWGAIRTQGINSPLKWEVHILVLDDETHDVHPNYYCGWNWDQYELWKPCVAPASPPLAEGEDHE